MAKPTLTVAVIMTMIVLAGASDANGVYSPCSDSKISKGDGFTFGLAFSSKESFFSDQVQLSPCDTRLGLAGKSAQLAVFRPKVDEMSLLTIDTSQFSPIKAGGYMVAFGGQKYAARSLPVMIADDSHTITSFTLVLEFRKGTLEILHWKSLGCGSCSEEFVCLNGTDCAVPTSKCKGNGGGNVDCSIGIQLTFSGTDRNLETLNSWYEVSKLRQHSLYGLFANALGSSDGNLI